MAGAVLNTIQRKLSFLIPKASSSSTSSDQKPPIDAQQELQNLEKTMRRIHAELDDAEETDVIDKSEHLRLRELREIAYDAEDVMDDYEYEVLHAKVEARRRARENNADVDINNNIEVFDYNSYQPEISISDDLTCRVREIRQRFEEVTNDWSRICLREKDEKRRRTKRWEAQETTSFPDVAVTFGRKDEKDQIMEWLLREEDEQIEDAISVLTIIGMGGIGKTTLAQIVFNDPRVSKYFDMSAWVYVSENFSVADLTKKILTSLNMGRDCMSSSCEHHLHNGMSLDDLYRSLKNKLEGKKFFLVLDDVWNEKVRLWDSLKRPFTGVGIGKILVTSRNEKVAKIMQTTTPIYLSKLCSEDSWSLFKNIAFGGRNDNSPYSLIDIGRNIVKRCEGLPLAVKVVASILRHENDEEEWKDILKSEFWEVENEGNDVLPALKLSYDRMPTEMRPCFMYLSLFPKNSQFYKTVVVQQWMSHGLLHAKGQKTEEDIGNAYFLEFCQRSIVQCDDEVLSNDQYFMHDLIHDLARSVSRDEYALVTVEKMCHIFKTIPKTIRHVAAYLGDGFEMKHLLTLLKSKKLCTLLLHNVNGCSIVELLRNFTCLRTLELKDTYGFDGKTVLPDALGELKHLRYLSFGGADSAHESICKLYHLQTLRSGDPIPVVICDLPRSRGGLKLPRGIGDLINLRHLHGFNCSTLDQEVAGLTNLRTLERFSVGHESWRCKVRHLKNLTNLRGSLAVDSLLNVRWSDIITPTEESYLKNKVGIHALELDWGTELTRSGRNDEDENEKELAEHVMGCLRPHPKLRELMVREYPGAIFPAWLGDASFSKLHTITLWNSDCTFLPTLGRLPALKLLYVIQMQRVRSVGRELLCPSNPNPAAAAAAAATEDTESRRRSSYFPSLEELRFVRMKEWDEWSGVEVWHFPCLRTLGINKCPKLKRLPSLPALTQLFLSGECNPELLSGCCLPMLASLEFGMMNEWEEWNGVKASDLPRLRRLVIASCPRLKRLPSLPTLARLCLAGDWNPELLSCCRLSMLRRLKIRSFEPLTFTTQQWLHSLEELVISSSSMTSVAGIGNLSSLQRLKIKDCPYLAISPDEPLPPNLHPRNVIIKESLEAEKWYRDHVLSGSYATRRKN